MRDWTACGGPYCHLKLSHEPCFTATSNARLCFASSFSLFWPSPICEMFQETYLLFRYLVLRFQAHISISMLVEILLYRIHSALTFLNVFEHRISFSCHGLEQHTDIEHGIKTAKKVIFREHMWKESKGKTKGYCFRAYEGKPCPPPRKNLRAGENRPNTFWFQIAGFK